MCRYCLEFEPLRDAKKGDTKMTIKERADALYNAVIHQDIPNAGDLIEEALQAAFNDGWNNGNASGRGLSEEEYEEEKRKE